MDTSEILEAIEKITFEDVLEADRLWTKITETVQNDHLALALLYKFNSDIKNFRSNQMMVFLPDCKIASEPPATTKQKPVDNTCCTY